MKTHNVKCEEWLWAGLKSGEMNFAVLRDDGVFQRGDKVMLLRYNPCFHAYLTPRYPSDCGTQMDLDCLPPDFCPQDRPMREGRLEYLLETRSRSDLLALGVIAEGSDEADCIEAQITYVLSSGAGGIKGIEPGYAVVGLEFTHGL